LIGTQTGRLLGQFKPFALGAGRLFREDYLAPIGSGLRNRDLGELSLGAGRLLRLLPAAYGAEQAGKALLFPQEQDLGAVVDPIDTLSRVVRTNTGVPGDLALEYLKASSPGTGVGNMIASLSPPVAGILEQPDKYKIAMMLAKPKWAGAAALAYPTLKPYLP
jgi:hypothetical protein